MLEHTPSLVGLTGANGAGKDTVASMLSGALLAYHRKAAVVAFSDPLYEEIAQAFGVSVEQLKQRSTKELPVQWLSLERCNEKDFLNRLQELHRAEINRQGWGECQPVDLAAPRSPRQILQWWATEYRRAQNPLYWVQRFETHSHELLSAGVQHIIVSDVRFADEVHCIRSQGAEIWRVVRANLTPSSTGHVSEVTGDEFSPDATIHNEGSIDLLRIRSWQVLFGSHNRGMQKQSQAQL